MRWIIKRTLYAVVAIYASVTLTFFIIRLMPGNPIDAYIQQLMLEGVPYETAKKMAAALYSINLDEPLYLQYLKYLQNLLTGNLGTSILTGAPIIQVIAVNLPWTVFLISTSLTISFVVGVVLGIVIAYRRGGILDNSLSLIGIVMNAIPNYIVGLIFLIIFGLYVKVFPIGGAYDPSLRPGFNWPFIQSVLAHAFVPMLTYIVTSMWGWMLSMRASTISVLGQDYIVAAEARGLPKSRIALTYAGRNAILPLFTSFVIQLGYMFGGAIFIENIFRYPGIGYMLNMAISGRDYSLAQGCFLLVIIAVVIGNYIADLIYSKLDPRIKFE